MNVDLTTLPKNIDALHVAFASLAIIELILLVILLTLIIIGMLRRNKTPAASGSKNQESAASTIPQPIQKPEKDSEPVTKTITLKEATPDAALQLLGLLQQEARFIDFIEEDIQSFSDEEVGAAARIVHEGCHKVVHQHFELAPVRTENENSRVTIQKGFDPSSVRLTGNIVGKAPFKGTLVHRGWKITNIHLPKLSENHNVNVVAAAEVEL